MSLITTRSHLQLEEAAKDVADEVTRPRPVGEETVQDIQVMLKSDAHHTSIRGLKVPAVHTSIPSRALFAAADHLISSCRSLPLRSPSRCLAWWRCTASSSLPPLWRRRPPRCVCSVAAAAASSTTSRCLPACRATLCRASATSECRLCNSAGPLGSRGVFFPLRPTTFLSPQWKSRKGEVSRGSVLHHPGPLRLRGLPDPPSAGVSRRRASWRDAAPPAALLWPVRSSLSTKSNKFEIFFFLLHLLKKKKQTKKKRF